VWFDNVKVVWLPSFLVLRFGSSLETSASLSVAPYLSMFVMSNISGTAADFLIGKGWDRTFVRKTFQSVGFLGPSVFLILLMVAQTERAAVSFVTAGLGLHAVSQAGVYCNHQDISSGKKAAGVLLGLSNSVASLPGIFGVGVVGFILDWSHGSWNIVFMLTICVYLFGTVVYLLLGTAEPVF
jgi:MFS transporter, ACS family, solute carrier family 17 (sodium-dependent inorganic phosphate cotransporter), other